MAITAWAVLEEVPELQLSAQLALLASIVKVALAPAKAFAYPAHAGTRQAFTPWAALEQSMQLARRAQRAAAPSMRRQLVAMKVIQSAKLARAMMWTTLTTLVDARAQTLERPPYAHNFVGVDITSAALAREQVHQHVYLAQQVAVRETIPADVVVPTVGFVPHVHHVQVGSTWPIVLEPLLDSASLA